MARPLAGICLFMASFSDGYLSENSSTIMRVANSVVGGGRYLIDPELRGEKVVHHLKTAWIAMEFLWKKNYWLSIKEPYTYWLFKKILA